jgi:lipopolysaccharide biosynthesis glycosyltransferase
VDLALAFDAGYAAHAAVVMSTVADEMPETPLRFWLVAADDVDEATRSALTVAAGPAATVSFLEVDLSRAALPISHAAHLQYISAAMFLRLLIAEALPGGVDRLLYLDSDVLCTGSLAPLLEVDLAGAPLGAVRDAYTRRLVDMGGLPGLTGYRDLDPQAMYFNSGVLLMDVQRWKELDVTGRALDYVVRHGHEARYPDQDALNYALYGNWVRLSSRFNHMLSGRLEPAFGGKLSDASLLHLAGPIKPWHPGFPDCARRQLYWAHRARHPELGVHRHRRRRLSSSARPPAGSTASQPA